MGAQISSEQEANSRALKSGSKTDKDRVLSVARQLNLEAERDQWLDTLENRLVDSGSLESCSFYSQQGGKGVNQDTCLAWEKLDSRMEASFCGVFDGHGPNGHLVSQRIRDSLCKHLNDAYVKITYRSSRYQKLLKPRKSAPNYSPFVTPLGSPNRPTQKIPNWTPEKFVYKWQEIHSLAFEKMERDIRHHPKLDSRLSGSTATTLLRMNDDIFIASVGDARAVLASRSFNGKVEASPLTQDHKCKSPTERTRIENCGGRIFALSDEPSSFRVWPANDVTLGLAVTRAFGDQALKPYGVICVPDVIHRKITKTDEFVILASDGVWDVMSNQEAVDIVANCEDRTLSSKCLIERASFFWKRDLPERSMDDISAVIYYLHPN